MFRSKRYCAAYALSLEKKIEMQRKEPGKNKRRRPVAITPPMRAYRGLALGINEYLSANFFAKTPPKASIPKRSVAQ